MARPRGVPTYRKHKQSGQAVVTLTNSVGNRQDRLLGKYGSPESRQEYARVIGEWEAAGRQLPRSELTPDITVNELLLPYIEHVQSYYRHPDGTPTSEVHCQLGVVRRLKSLYGATLANQFDSLALDSLRTCMIQEGLCRTRINKNISRVKHIWKWAASKKLVPVGAYQLLLTVDGLRAGRSPAKEREPIVDRGQKEGQFRGLRGGR